MTFDHHADQRAIALQALFQHVVEHGGLAQWIFAAVGVAAVDHDPGRDLQSGQVAVDAGDAGAVVVRSVMTAAQHQVGVDVTRGLDDRGMALAVDTEMAMWMGGRAHGVTGHADTAVGAVLEAYRHAQAAGHLAMNLRLGGTGANGHPAQQVIEVPGGHGLQQFSCHRQAEHEYFTHQFAGQGQAAGHVVAAIKVRIVSQAFPANRGSRFFDVGAHHQEQLVADVGAQAGQVVSVFEG
ncbi:hypothetical protein D3C76_695090 [compost metagenome]